MQKDLIPCEQQLVPLSFEERRGSYIARTVNSVSPRIVNDELINALCNGLFFDRHACLDAYLPELKTISESSGKAHTAYSDTAYTVGCHFPALPRHVMICSLEHQGTSGMKGGPLESTVCVVSTIGIKNLCN